MTKELKEYSSITEPINEIAKEVNSILSKRERERYFEKIVLNYSLVENLLKWLVYVKLSWDKAGRKEILDEEMEKLRYFCKELNFYTALQIALSIDLINLDLHKEIDEVRKERNNLVHQYWIYSHRKNFRVLRKKLEKLSRVVNKLIEIFNQLTEEVGIEEVYEVFL